MPSIGAFLVLMSSAVDRFTLMPSAMRPDRQITDEVGKRKLSLAVKRSARFAIKALSPLDISAV